MTNERRGCPMRKIIVGEFISLDGVVEAPAQWHIPYVNDEMMGVVLGLANSTDTTSPSSTRPRAR